MLNVGLKLVRGA